ncbi:hypothetical protein Q9295_13875 [Xinfangfangia sp. CPCC 101601]|uniref:Uncharacterized protein n=1 Tax=Pseudogemmobacter lacusdianii TaxID=3069608 RepID=A0ABU0W0N7_9RHOB|nr:hypothetical protein [Xinfangfangia sp. CPCC 101601]MDQ2067463.1 hypothetical protein [Xinfangfangia sp. CPCC 101601]
MPAQFTLSQNTVRALLVVVGLASLGNIYYQLHIAPGWQWGPAIDKMPRHVVTDMRTALYDEGKADFVKAEYLSAKAELDPALFPELEAGVTAKSTLLRPLLGDGRQVTAVHQLEINGTTRTVVDIIDIGARGGRIDSIQRYIAQN